MNRFWLEYVGLLCPPEMTAKLAQFTKPCSLSCYCTMSLYSTAWGFFRTSYSSLNQILAAKCRDLLKKQFYLAALQKSHTSVVITSVCCLYIYSPLLSQIWRWNPDWQRSCCSCMFLFFIFYGLFACVSFKSAVSLTGKIRMTDSLHIFVCMCSLTTSQHLVYTLVFTAFNSSWAFSKALLSRQLKWTSGCAENSQSES